MLLSDFHVRLCSLDIFEIALHVLFLLRWCDGTRLRSMFWARVSALMLDAIRVDESIFMLYRRGRATVFFSGGVLQVLEPGKLSGYGICQGGFRVLHGCCYTVGLNEIQEFCQMQCYCT